MSPLSFQGFPGRDGAEVSRVHTKLKEFVSHFVWFTAEAIWLLLFESF